MERDFDVRGILKGALKPAAAAFALSAAVLAMPAIAEAQSSTAGAAVEAARLNSALSFKNGVIKGDRLEGVVDISGIEVTMSWPLGTLVNAADLAKVNGQPVTAEVQGTLANDVFTGRLVVKSPVSVTLTFTVPLRWKGPCAGAEPAPCPEAAPAGKPAPARQKAKSAPKARPPALEETDAPQKPEAIEKPMTPDPALPDRFSFSCKLREQPLAPNGLVLQETTESPVPLKDTQRNRPAAGPAPDDALTPNFTRVFDSNAVYISLARGEEGETDAARYETRFRNIPGGEYMCAFERTVPPVENTDPSAAAELYVRFLVSAVKAGVFSVTVDDTGTDDDPPPLPPRTKCQANNTEDGKTNVTCWQRLKNPHGGERVRAWGSGLDARRSEIGQTRLYRLKRLKRTP